MSTPVPDGVRVLNVVQASANSARAANIVIWLLLVVMIVIAMVRPILLIPAVALLIAAWYGWRRIRSNLPSGQLIALDDQSHYLIVFQLDLALIGFRSRQMFFDLHKVDDISLGHVKNHPTLNISDDGDTVHIVFVPTESIGEQVIRAVRDFQAAHAGAIPDDETRLERARAIIDSGLQKRIDVK